ncbi:ESCRT-II complex, vps25 subunit [Sarocladium strictum]
MATSPTPFSYPPEYNFPPFYTRQPNATTHHAQLTKWSSLVLAYCRHHRVFRLNLLDDESPLFRNTTIDRRLSQRDIRDVALFMHKEGRVEFLSGGVNGDNVFVYWKKLEEWAAAVEQWVDDTGQKGAVVTIYEITQGDGTKGTDLHGMDTEVLLKALNILVKRGKAQIFGQEESQGVKFF